MKWGRVRRDQEAALHDELRDYLERETAANIAAGMTAEQASDAARRKLGNRLQIREKTRAVWRRMWLERLAQDLRYGVRMMRRSPGFTLIAVLSLALGIGANTAIFGLLDQVLLRMLPVRKPEELRIVSVTDRRGRIATSQTYPLYALLRDNNRSAEALAGYSNFPWRDQSTGSNQAWHDGQMVSGNYFDVLGVNAAIGRTLTPEDDSVDGVGGPQGAVAMLSHGYWRRAFQKDPSVLGKQINVEGAWLTVVGVSAPEFFGTQVGTSPDIFVPIRLQPLVSPPGNLLHDKKDSSTNWVTVVGRLRSGVNESQAKAEMGVLLNQYDISRGDDKPSRTIGLAPGSRGLSRLRARFSKPLQALMVLVGIVLLIACANIANLQLSRADARQKEIAVRMAIGAGRGRIIRQLLTESLLLSVLGGGLGLLFAVWSSGLLVRMLPQGQTRVALEVTADPRVLAFTAALSILTGLLFGLAPAMRSTRVSLNESLKQGKDRARRFYRFDLGKALVVIEVALSLLLLVGAGLFVGTLRNLVGMDTGFVRQNVLQVDLDLDAGRVPLAQHKAVYSQIVERMKSIPGVRAASLANRGLLQEGQTSSGPVSFPGYTFAKRESRDLPESYVDPEYFSAAGIPLRLGRLFSETDGSPALQVAVVNETLARRYFPGQNPVGKRYQIGDSGRVEIVGVVSDAKYNSLRLATPPMAYYPWKQVGDPRLRALIVRTEGDPAALAGRLRQALTSIQPGLYQNIRTLSSQLNESLVQERLLARLSGFFGLLAMLLASIGLYGTMSYGVARRESEIGVRVALGAFPSNVVWMVLRETLALALAGVAIGVPSALALSRFVASFLYGVTPNDPWVIAAAVLILVGAATLAAYLPARRAAHIDPMRALRYE